MLEMDVPNNLSRARLATSLLGTEMMRHVFRKVKDNFIFQARLKEKFNLKNSDPCSMNFKELYDLCTKNMVEILHPSSGDWEMKHVDSKDVSLGDDIKRLQLLYEFFSKAGLDSLHYRTQLIDINKTLNDIIKRFSVSEGINFEEIFRNIMQSGDIDEIIAENEFILNKGNSLILFMHRTE